MAVHEPVHTCQFSASCVAISAIAISVSVTIIALVSFVAIFLSHEGVRVLLELFADSRWILPKLPPFRMLVDELLIIDQRRMLAEVLGNFRMALQDPVRPCQFSTGRVVVTLTLRRHRLFRRHGLRRHRLLVLSRRSLSACRGACPEQHCESKHRSQRSAGVQASRFDCLNHKNLLCSACGSLEGRCTRHAKWLLGSDISGRFSSLLEMAGFSRFRLDAKGPFDRKIRCTG